MTQFVETNRDPWEPLAHEEGTPAERAWLAYRDTTQDLTGVAEITQLSLRAVQMLARENRWQDRLQALERHRARERERIVTEELVQDAVRTTRERLALCDDLAIVLRAEAQALLAQRRAAPGDVSILTPNQLSRLFRDVIQLEQLLLGRPTERTEETGIDPSRLGDAELEQLQALLACAVSH